MAAPSLNQYKELVDDLRTMINHGGFSIAVLTDENGLPVAFSGTDEDTSEAQSAAVAQIQKMILRVREHMSMGEPEEFVMNDVNGTRLVCRSFEAATSPLILAVQIPDRGKPYRKLMNQLIRSVQKNMTD